jgi:hypothetical protein
MTGQEVYLHLLAAKPEGHNMGVNYETDKRIRAIHKSLHRMGAEHEHEGGEE